MKVIMQSHCHLVFVHFLVECLTTHLVSVVALGG